MRFCATSNGRLSLGDLAGLLSRCVLVVANDTGQLHLAAAVGRVTVGIERTLLHKHDATAS